ncbi:MAG: amidophosphoribosyltransferase [Flavobacteriia bacterium]|nr:MAG: amidophosphoribosyltransferase [Flavobacteriia bacterium]
MCGIVGFIGREKVIYDLYSGLLTLQHRGQDSAGIVTFKDNFRIKKGLGLVNEVFDTKHFERLDGTIGLGHVRYTTHGNSNLENAQPVTTNYPFGIAMVHNGNVTNFKEMNHAMYHDYHVMPTSSNDVEMILYTLAAELKNKDLVNISTQDIFEAVKVTQQKIEGAYAVIAVIANRGLLAFQDSHGIRPLMLGKKETERGVTYGLASESVTFDHLGYEIVRDLKPGEIVYIDNQNQLHSSIGYEEKQAFCVFEYIYFAREDANFLNKNVAGSRVRMGQTIARQIKAAGLTPDVVIDVPSSGYFAASGLAEALGVPYHRGLFKSSYIGRSFIAPDQEMRENIVKQKLNPIKKSVRDKRVVVVDDSIVRGTTSKRIVQTLKDAGAKEIYFVSSAPPVTSPCVYGIDMSVKTELIAANKSIEEIRDYIGAEALFYLQLEDLDKIFNTFSTCRACFNGKYPAGNVEKMLQDISDEKSEMR